MSTIIYNKVIPNVSISTRDNIKLPYWSICDIQNSLSEELSDHRLNLYLDHLCLSTFQFYVACKLISLDPHRSNLSR